MEKEPNLYEELYDTEDPRYIKSFVLTDTDEYLSFFERFGYVVIRDILTAEQCEETIADIWEVARSDDPEADPNDITKPFEFTGIASEGILPFAPVFTEIAVRNRCNAGIFSVCKNILGDDDVLINHDRYGLFRPTKGVVKDGKELNFPNYKTKLNVHLDMNPWNYIDKSKEGIDIMKLDFLSYGNADDFIAENNICYSIYRSTEKEKLEDIDETELMKVSRHNIQGLINLADNLEEDGGFHLVPEFHKKYINWTLKNVELGTQFSSASDFILLPKRLPLYNETIRITCRAGSIIIWSQLLPHGSRPNDSNRPRYAQFFKVFPRSKFPDDILTKRKKFLQTIMGLNYITLTDDEKKLLDI
jgi:hypothetical protein